MQMDSTPTPRRQRPRGIYAFLMRMKPVAMILIAVGLRVWAWVLRRVRLLPAVSAWLEKMAGRAARRNMRLPEPRAALGGDEHTVAEDVEFKSSDNKHVLRATLFSPRAATMRGRGEGEAATVLPVVIVRTPYGRWKLDGLGRAFAEQGMRCLCCDARGRFASGGQFFPVANEVADGGAGKRNHANRPMLCGA